MTVFFLVANSLILAILLWRMLKVFVDSPIRVYLVPALAIKLFAGIGLGLIYQYYYEGGDTFSFFDEANKLSALFRSNIEEYGLFLFFNDGHISGEMAYSGHPRALFLVKLLSLVNVITGDNYWLSSLFFSFFSFAGLWALADTFSRKYIQHQNAIVVSLLFFPSVVFWSAGIIKEAIALGAMGFLLASFLKFIFYKRYHWWHLPIDVLMIFLLWNTKYYYAGILFLLMMGVISTLVIRSKLPAVARVLVYQVGIFIMFCAFFLVLVSQLHPNFYFNRILSVIVDNYYAFAALSAPDGYIHYYELSADWESILFNAPKAFFSGLFRPLIGESAEGIKILAGIENLVLLLLTASALFKLPKRLPPEDRLLLIGAVTYIIVLSVFLALSAPNFGTLLRYKVGFLPVLLLVITINNPAIEKLNTLVK